MSVVKLIRYTFHQEKKPSDWVEYTDIQIIPIKDRQRYVHVFNKGVEIAILSPFDGFEIKTKSN